MLSRSLPHSKTAALLTAGVLACSAGAVLAQHAPLAREKARSDYPNYDIRDEAVSASASSPKSARTAAVAPSAGRWKQSMAAGRSALASRVPNLQTENNRFGTAPEIVGTSTGAKLLTAESTAQRQDVLRGFLTENAALYGLSEGEIASLIPFADYANPAGNMSWVGLKQEINGLPVFQAELLAGFSGRGALARTTSNLAPGLEGLSLPITPALSAAEAIARASATIGRKVEAAKLTAMPGED